jgi:hypothetical protein
VSRRKAVAIGAGAAVAGAGGYIHANRFGKPPKAPKEPYKRRSEVDSVEPRHKQTTFDAPNGNTYNVDRKMKRTVVALNRSGMRTFASDQGDRRLINDTKDAYVAIRDKNRTHRAKLESGLPKKRFRFDDDELTPKDTVVRFRAGARNRRKLRQVATKKTPTPPTTGPTRYEEGREFSSGERERLLPTKSEQQARINKAFDAIAAGQDITKAYGRGPAMDAARWGAGVSAASAAGGGASYGAERVASKDEKKAKKTAVAAVLGGGAGQAGYQLAGYQAKHSAARKHEASGMSRSKTDKKLKNVKAMHGAFTAGMYRNYPKDMPGAKTHRALGWTHRGKSGTALGTAVTLGASAAAVAAARRTKEKK